MKTALWILFLAALTVAIMSGWIENTKAVKWYYKLMADIERNKKDAADRGEKFKSYGWHAILLIVAIPIILLFSLLWSGKD